MQLIIIRHPPVVADGLCYGQSHVPLMDGEPEKTANRITLRLPPTIDKTYTSPLPRCRALAEALSPLEKIQDVPELMEANFGDWEQKRWDEISKDKLDYWLEDFVHRAPPAGESLETLAQRVKQFLDTQRTDSNQSCLVITHACPIRCMLASVLHIPLDQIFKMSVHHGFVFKLQLGTNAENDQVMFA